MEFALDLESSDKPAMYEINNVQSYEHNLTLFLFWAILSLLWASEYFLCLLLHDKPPHSLVVLKQQ